MNKDLKVLLVTKMANVLAKKTSLEINVISALLITMDSLIVNIVNVMPMDQPMILVTKMDPVLAKIT